MDYRAFKFFRHNEPHFQGYFGITDVRHRGDLQNVLNICKIFHGMLQYLGYFPARKSGCGDHYTVLF